MRLNAQQGAIDQKQNAFKPVGLDQVVAQADNGSCFARAGRHGYQCFAVAGFPEQFMFQRPRWL